MKPVKESFKLSKVKLVKDGGLDCHFQVDETIGQEVYQEKYHTESAKDLHPDLASCFNSLHPILARVYHMNFFRALMGNEDFEATAEQSAIAEKMYQEILQKIKVTEIRLSGSNENEGVVLIGSLKGNSAKGLSMVSEKINFSDSFYGFEEDLEITIDEIKDEVYSFLFEGKRAQLSLFGEETEE